MTLPLWLIITIASASGAVLGAGAVFMWAVLADAFPPDPTEG